MALHHQMFLLLNATRVLLAGPSFTAVYFTLCSPRTFSLWPYNRKLSDQYFHSSTTREG